MTSKDLSYAVRTIQALVFLFWLCLGGLYYSKDRKTRKDQVTRAMKMELRNAHSHAINFIGFKQWQARVEAWFMGLQVLATLFTLDSLNSASEITSLFQITSLRFVNLTSSNFAAITTSVFSLYSTAYFTLFVFIGMKKASRKWPYLFFAKKNNMKCLKFLKSHKFLKYLDTCESIAFELLLIPALSTFCGVLACTWNNEENQLFVKGYDKWVTFTCATFGCVFLDPLLGSVGMLLGIAYFRYDVRHNRYLFNLFTCIYQRIA